MSSQMKTLLIIFLVLLSGCQGIFGGDAQNEISESGITEQEHLFWSIRVAAVEIPGEDGGEFRGWIAAGGHFEGEVHGARVLFLDEGRTLIEDVEVGDLTRQSERHWVNTTLPTRPTYVTARVDGWSVPSNIEFDQLCGVYLPPDGIQRVDCIYDPSNITD